MKTELEKLEQKKGLYERGEYILVLDSLNEEVINPEFQVIDNNLYLTKVRREYLSPHEQDLLGELRAGNKITATDQTPRYYSQIRT